MGVDQGDAFHDRGSAGAFGAHHDMRIPRPSTIADAGHPRLRNSHLPHRLLLANTGARAHAHSVGG